MKQQSQIIYTHNLSSGFYRKKNLLPRQSGFLYAVVNIFYNVGLFVLNVARFLARVVFHVNFYVGSKLLNLAEKILRPTTRGFFETRLHVRERFKVLSQAHVKFGLGVFIFFLIGVLGMFKAAGLVAVAQQAKDRIIQFALLGDSYLHDAKSSLESQNFTAAQYNFLQARDRFAAGAEELSSLGNSANSLLDLIPQKRDAQDLLEASREISKAGNLLLDFYKQAGNLKFSQGGLSSIDQKPEETLAAADHALLQARDAITQARLKLAGVNPDIIPEKQRDSFVALQSQIAGFDSALVNFYEVFGLLKELLSGQKQVLVLMQNNNELRATGGFIGTYGALALNNGSIARMDIRSIYDLDGQLKEAIAPPGPMLEVNDRWYLRDSNWFSDFRLSASKASIFYEKEGGETPDMVLAINTNVITDILRLTGPISMPAYNAEFSAENFVEKMQAISTQSDQLSENSPKQVIADFFPLLLQHLSELSASQKLQFLELLQQNLSGKNILAYSRRPELQKRLDAFNWSGAVGQSDRDYLMLVGSNLGGTKTDLFIDQQVSLISTIASDGSVTNELTIKRKNRMPKVEYGFNKTFLRVLVPEGSKLISASGFDYKVYTAKPGEEKKRDPDVQAWEKGAVYDLSSGTIVGLESGKTFFGNWVNLGGGEEREIKITYTLPFRLKDTDRLSLLYQKQGGAAPMQVVYAVDFSGRQLEWNNFSPKKLETDSLTVENMLTQDEFYGMVFRKRGE